MRNRGFTLIEVLVALAIVAVALAAAGRALGVVTDNFDSPLSEEFSRTLREMELGLPRRQALEKRMRTRLLGDRQCLHPRRDVQRGRLAAETPPQDRSADATEVFLADPEPGGVHLLPGHAGGLHQSGLHKQRPDW